MMPIWFLAWIIPLCVIVAFILFGLMFAVSEKDECDPEHCRYHNIEAGL